MGQPTRRGKKTPISTHVKGTGEGLDYCNDCPFFSISETKDSAICNTSDILFKYKEGDLIKVPVKCGNHKNDGERI